MARFDVFLSYAGTDRERVLQLKEELVRLDYNVFFDQESIDPAGNWEDRLELAVRASRVLILCWSAAAKDSPYVTFEWTHARALRRPIAPWCLDGTALPVMQHWQMLPDGTPAEIAARIARLLPLKLAALRRLQAVVALLLVAAAAFAAWLIGRPPLPWTLRGTIKSGSGEVGHPIAGAHVDIYTKDKAVALGKAVTNRDGMYTLQLPQPQPTEVYLEFWADGYKGDHFNTESAHPADPKLEAVH